jgi:adenine-specific DNA-methyltransferase
MLARNLLTDDGVIFISIDEREYANIRDICDEIYGEKNYFGDIVWEATTQPINAGSARFGLQKKTEPILIYGKCKSKVAGFVLEEIEGSLSYPHNGKFGPCRFEIIEKSDSGDYSRPSMKFQILGQYPRDGKRWQIGEDTARQLEREGKVEIIDGIVKKAVYPEDELDKRQYKPFWSLFLADTVGTAQTGKDELNSIMEKPMGFDTVKPTSLIKKLISYMGDSYTVLDFFSGTATTADACLQINASTKGNRKFIMVQIDEECKAGTDAFNAGYSNICDIGEERIRRAGKKIKEESPLTTLNLDTGFRVFKLDDTNMNDVYYSPTEYSQNLLSMLESNVKPDRTDLDLLFGCILEWGLPLSLSYTSEQIEGCTVHNYNDGDLIACFDENVPDSVIKEIAKKQPLRAVFRDSSFANSPSKINVGEIFKLLAPDTRVKVI